MPSPADIARHFNLSRARITQMVKQGMPRTSFRAAERWREARGKKRAPTNSTANSQRKPKKGRPRKRRSVPRTGDTLYDALQAAIIAQEEAYEIMLDAMAAGDDSQISSRLSVHNKALDQRMKTEEVYREELERRKLLIPYTAAAEEFRRGFVFIINRIRRMPQSLASQCNRLNPMEAFTVLDREVNMMIADTQKEYAPYIPPADKPKPIPNDQPTATTAPSPQR